MKLYRRQKLKTPQKREGLSIASTFIFAHGDKDLQARDREQLEQKKGTFKKYKYSELTNVVRENESRDISTIFKSAGKELKDFQKCYHGCGDKSKPDTVDIFEVFESDRIFKL